MTGGRFATASVAKRSAQKQTSPRSLRSQKRPPASQVAEAVFALAQRRDKYFRMLNRARFRPFDPKVADRIVARLQMDQALQALLASDPELPSRHIVARWRRAEPEFDRTLRIILTARRWMAPPVPDAVVEDVVEHILTGGSFNSYTQRPDTPSYNTLRRWMRDPNFAREVARACEWREAWFHDQILMAADRTAPGPVRKRAREIGALKRQLRSLSHRPRKPLYYRRRGPPG